MCRHCLCLALSRTRRPLEWSGKSSKAYVSPVGRGGRPLA
ncbi:hypothetical protein E2C01_068740 [Portunus trituberculatus]|uniref:Uncharacterized protein n=1 Tax=Portunus trituberculatus TaxID=210409 RepID=A0A5B7HST3_PORTR|nr:hypothetical protein [Portunus trituberculatus]